MAKVILDTNIYLNFYRLDNSQSLEMLKSLNQLIKTKKFELILPRQIEDEFIRNKNSKSAIYGDHILNFQKGLEVQFKVPHLIKSTKKIEQIKRTVKKLQLLKKRPLMIITVECLNQIVRLIKKSVSYFFMRTVRPKPI